MVNKRVLGTIVAATLIVVILAVVSSTSAEITHEKHVIHVPILIHYIHHHHKPITKPKKTKPKIKKVQTKKFIHRYHTYWY